MIENVLRCNRCGKIMTEFDEISGFSYADLLDYSTEYPDEVFDIDLCPECWHWLMSLLRKECKHDPFVNIDDWAEDHPDELDLTEEDCDCEPEKPHAWEQHPCCCAEPCVQEEIDTEAEASVKYELLGNGVHIKSKHLTINVMGGDTATILNDLCKVFDMKEKKDEQAN